MRVGVSVVALVLASALGAVSGQAAGFESKWKIAERPDARVTLSWEDESSFGLDFGHGEWGVAMREDSAYVGVVRPAGAGARIRVFRATPLPNGDVRVTWRDDWHSSVDRVETWELVKGATVHFSSLAGAWADEALPAFGEAVDVDRKPELLGQVPPVIPEIAKEAGVYGTVRVEVLVGRDGGVHRTRVTKSIPMLDAAAVECARQWLFEPAKYKGERVPAWTEVGVKFEKR